MSTFSGQFYYTVDTKGRIIMPAQFRETLRRHFGEKVHVTNHKSDKCLLIYPQEEWDKLLEKVKEIQRNDKAMRYFRRKVIGAAYETALDKQGRVLLPQALREDSLIEINSDIVIVGDINKIEIWNRSEWNRVMNPDESDIEEYGESLSELGL